MRICKLQDTAKTHEHHIRTIPAASAGLGDKQGAPPVPRVGPQLNTARQDATAHNALHAHAHRNNRMAWDDRRLQGISLPHCTMSAPFEGRPLTRRITRPKRVALRRR